MPGSVKSAASSRSRASAPQYRCVARQSNVDETLFGDGGAARRSGPAVEEVIITGKDTVQRQRVIGRTTQASDGAVVIPASQLNRIKEGSRVVSKKEMQEEQRRKELAKEEKMAEARRRKEQMMKMEEERKKAQNAESEIEKKDRVKRNGILDKAKNQIDEGLDDVKHMNQMMLYSKVVTIRDAQIQEKRYIEQEKQEEDKQLDMMMEIERLKALKMYEEREKKRAEDQRKGAQVIVEQIRGRQATRMKIEEERDQERAFVLKQIEAQKAEEIESQKAKRVAASKLMEEVNAANSAGMKIKEEKMLAGKIEDQKILDYQRSKEARERMEEEEKRREAEEKERQVAAMRAQQEKQADRAAELDALRAKRAVEAAERKAREKEQREAARLKAINAEMEESRQQQQAEKERTLAEQAQNERDEFERIILVQQQQEDAERRRKEEQHAVRIQHSKQLQDQIAAREEKFLQDRRDFLEEGNVIRSQMAAERKKLEGIKERKIGDLKKSGVPEKYWGELANKKIAV